MKKQNVEQLEDVLFQTVITALQVDPSAGWAQVARGLLSDYRVAEEGSMPAIQAENIKSVLKDSAPFKLNAGG